MRKTLLPFLLLFSMVANCIEVDMSVPGFPEIARYFNVSEGTVQLTIAYNFLGFCLGGLLYGYLSECYGRRKIMLLGNAIMLVGAIGCSLAPTMNLLLLARFIQGIGASTSIVLVFAIIADVYDGMKAMQLIGFINASLAILMSIAPVIGGLINEAIGWKGNYLTVATLSFISWLLQWLFLPETNNKLSSFSLGNMAKDYKKLLSSNKFITAALIPSLLFAAYMSYIAASAFLYKQTFGLSTLQFVVHQVIIISTFAVVSMVASRIIQILGDKKVVSLGMSLCGVSGVLLLLVGLLFIHSPYVTTFLLSLFSVGFAMCYPIIFAKSMSIFPELRGSASAMIMSMRALLVFGFTALTSYLYNGQLVTVAIPINLGIFLALTLVLMSYVKQEKVNGVNA